MKVASAYFSQKGPKQRNDDSVLPLMRSGEIWWSAVADGMGGHPGGSIASRAALDALAQAIETNPRAEMSELFASAQNALQKLADETPELRSMGTTLSVIRLSERAGQVGHVGDSRIYQLRGDGLLDRTVDQTEVEELIQRGVLNRARARQYPRRNVLLSVLSPSRDFNLHTEEFSVLSGDRIVLLTDGVSSKLLRREIRDLSLKSQDVKSLTAAIQSEIEARGPIDDYSAVCIEISEMP